MGSRSAPVFNLTTENAGNYTIPELISLLKSVFQPTDFHKVEEFLISREENMKKAFSEMSAEMEYRKKESDHRETKHREMELMKLQVQDELNKYKRECDRLREQVTRFSEEQKLEHDRAKRAEERYAKLLEDFTKVENDKGEVILQLRFARTDLECEKTSKRRSEAEVEAWKKKFGELELRVLRLEQDTETLVIASGDPLLKEKIGMAMKALDENVGPISEKIAGKKQISGNEKSRNGLGFGNDSPSLARERTEESISNFSEKVHTLAAGLRRRPESGVIIEINDSDDELPTVAHSSKTGEGNGGRGMQNDLLASTSKRKRNSKNDDDDDYKIGECKMKQLQDLVCENKSSPINDCTTMPDLGGSLLGKFIPDGMDSSDSDSDSSSLRDTYSDSYMNALIAKYKRENKTWTLKTDMLLAFERDPQICMNAVCALYRQQIFPGKSIKGSLFSKQGGFNHCDVLRGTTLAKFLIDGDPRGKLKKSVSELQQYDPKGLEDCIKLATQHSAQLFEIYQKKEDPFFRPFLI